MKEKKVYLDFQIFDMYAKQKAEFSWIKSKTGYTYYCSTAHMEELYRALKNAKTELARSQAQAIKDAIGSLCTEGVLGPGPHGASLKKESMDLCLERIEKYDTTETILQNAERLKDLHDQPPAFSHDYHGSPEQWKTVWNETQIKNAICEQNVACSSLKEIAVLYDVLAHLYGEEAAYRQFKNAMCELDATCLWLREMILVCESFAQQHEEENRQFESAICELKATYSGLRQMADLYDDLTKIYGREKADRQLLQRFNDMCEISFGCYQKIKSPYGRIEYVIEQLARILSRFGYCRDNKVRTFNSGEYDITHLICGTFCDYFVTEDKKLRHRALAIYYYLQVPVQVMSLEDYKNLS